jgi:hypothetical protein
VQAKQTTSVEYRAAPAPVEAVTDCHDFSGVGYEKRRPEERLNLFGLVVGGYA